MEFFIILHTFYMEGSFFNELNELIELSKQGSKRLFENNFSKKT